MSKIKFIKALDLWLGSLLVRLLPKPSATASTAAEPQSVLIIRPGGIGDAVLLIPVIQALRARFPLAAIDILAERRNAGVFALASDLRRIYLYDMPGQLLALLSRRYAVVIDTEQWHCLSAVVARLVRAPVKIGFATNRRRRMFTQNVTYRLDEYEALAFLRLLQPLGLTGSGLSDTAWLSVPDSARQSVAAYLPEGGSIPLIVLAPGASIPEKRWGEERFRAVVQWCRERDADVVLVGGGGDRRTCERIAAGLPVINLAGSTSLAETAAILERAVVVISGDSGVLHIAAGLGRPTVALFGPSAPVKWAPQGSRHVILRPSDCPSCSSFGDTPACPHGVCCLREIAVDAVTGAIALLLKR